jgi:hypothetical protein
MGALAGIVSDVIDNVTGQNRGTSLDDFLSKFGSSEGKHVNTIDPLATFEVSFAFEPTSGSTKDTGILAVLGSAATNIVKNSLNNITGGLAGSLANDLFGTSVKD